MVLWNTWGASIMDDRVQKAFRIVAVALAILTSILFLGRAEAETTRKAGTESAPLPFGMVDHKVNTGPYDPGIAVSKEQSPFYPSRASAGGRKVTSSMFDAPEVCGGCHTEIYKQWKGSMHSNAWTDPIYRAALDHISKGSGGSVDNLCMGCHTPIGVVTGEANPAG